MPPLTPKFLPVSRQEMKMLGWDALDILLITGDAYVDHPSFGVSVIGRVLCGLGYRTGIIPQPDWKSEAALQVMGRPLLGIGVSAGNLDSMVNIYTVGRRLRKDDAYSPGGVIGRRPPHAATVYAQLAKKAFPGIPVFLGGLEASLRRLTHYDYWQDRIRPSILTDSKADILIYGMGERQITEIMNRLSAGKGLENIPGTARFLGGKESKTFESGTDYIELDSYETHLEDKDALMRTMIALEKEMNPGCGRGMIQRHGDRLVVVEHPGIPLSEKELDSVYDLPFSGVPHPMYKERIPAFETIRFSIPAVRGCPGGCSFCGLVAHQGRFVTNRSSDSVIREIERLTRQQGFTGTISDIGGAAGNIFGHGQKNPAACQSCRRISCLYPAMCPNYLIDEKPLLSLLRTVRAMPGIKHVHINSGIRLDLAVQQPQLMREIVAHHVSGHLKVAPEHLHPAVLKGMRKNPPEDFYKFVDFFTEESRKCGKQQYLIPLFISNFPGCTETEMKIVDDYLSTMRWSPQQVQDYIPLPMTMGAAMYYCGKNPDGTEIQVNRGLAERRPQVQTLKRKRHFGADDRPPRRNDRYAPSDNRPHSGGGYNRPSRPANNERPASRGTSNSTYKGSAPGKFSGGKTSHPVSSQGQRHKPRWGSESGNS